jgi:L-ribulose-5-phosphate 3-epimerase UlaE
MYIESNEDAINLINTINSPYFRLHLDIGHAYCTEKDYVNSIAQALPYIAYMHLADIKDGYNLRFYVLEDLSSELKDINIDFTYAGYLFYFKRTDTFLFVDKHWSYYFCTEMFSPMEKTDVETFKQQMKKSFFVDYIPINHTNVNHFPEVNLVDVSAYVDAIPEISISLQNKIRPILNFLRSFKIANTAIIPQPVCNTVKGKVHYHEMPGEGGIDFTAVLEVLKDSYYEGFITVELYNHVEVWEKALSPTLCYLNQCINSKLEVSNA